MHKIMGIIETNIANKITWTDSIGNLGIIYESSPCYSGKGIAHFGALGRLTIISSDLLTLTLVHMQVVI